MSYAPVNGLELYYDIEGEHTDPGDTEGAGRPLILLPGGLLTIEASFADVRPALAAKRPTIAVELQGHGRTADIDRPFSLAASADDVVGLLDHLGIDRADFFGFSLGALVSN